MARHTALIIPVTGPVREVEYDEKDSYNTMRAGVGGTITTCPGFEPMHAYANDNALAEGLERNLRVSRAVRGKYPYAILGDVIIPKLTDGKRAKLAKMGLL